MRAITQPEIDQQVFNRYDKYCHGRIDRREFMRRAGALGAAALVMAQGLLPNYAKAQTVSFTDSRIKASYVTYSSPGANGEKMRGYLIQPARNGPWPAVQWLKAHQLSTKRLGATHGFHNNSTPRFDEAAAKLSWERTIAFFKKNLA